MSQLPPLAVGNHSINIDEIKKQYGTPPWGYPVVVTDQTTRMVICQAPRNHYRHIDVVGDKPGIRLAISVTGEKHRHDK